MVSIKKIPHTYKAGVVIIAVLLTAFLSPKDMQDVTNIITFFNFGDTHSQADIQNQSEQYVLERVVDGDTIIVRSVKTDETMKVRLLGIDTPETVDPRKPVQCFGKEASAHIQDALSDVTFSLLYDTTQETTDTYDRTLAYVVASDTSTVNEAMIRDGYAYEYTYKTPYIYQQQFKHAEREAREQKRGLWNPANCPINQQDQ